MLPAMFVLLPSVAAAAAAAAVGLSPEIRPPGAALLAPYTGAPGAAENLPM